MQLPKDKSFARRGALPLFLLLIIGVVVVVGGTYVVREQFLKEGKSGKTAYDQSKIKKQIENPQKLPELKEEAEGKLATGKYVYKPTAAAEPSFSINPPAGWENLGGGTGYKVQFKSTEVDREDQEDGLYAEARPQISIAVFSAQGKNLEEWVAYAKKTVPAPFENMRILSERKTRYAGQEAAYFETKLTAKGASIQTADYFLVKDGFVVHVGATALEEAWGKREPAISGSLATFRLL